MALLQRCYILRLLFFQSDIYFSDIFLSPNPIEYYIAAVRQRESFQLTVYSGGLLLGYRYNRHIKTVCVCVLAYQI